MKQKSRYNCFGDVPRIIKDIKGNRYIETTKDGVVVSRHRMEDAEQKEPLLTGIFLADLISSYEEIKKASGKKTARKFKIEVARAFDLNLRSINSAIQRYFIKQRNYEMSFKNLPKIDIKCDIGTLDNEDAVSQIKQMANNVRTVPEQFRHDKVEEGIQTIGSRFGRKEKYRHAYLNSVKQLLEQEDFS